MSFGFKDPKMDRLLAAVDDVEVVLESQPQMSLENFNTDTVRTSKKEAPMGTEGMTLLEASEGELQRERALAGALS